MTATGVGDDQTAPQLLEIDAYPTHLFTTRPVLDLERAAEQRGVVILDPGGKTHEARLEIAREMNDGGRRRGGRTERVFDRRDERHRERGARAEAGAPGRVAGERDFERRQIEVLRHQSDQRTLGGCHQLGASGDLDP